MRPSLVPICCVLCLVSCRTSYRTAASKPGPSVTHRERLEHSGRRPLDTSVAEAEVIVLATFVDAAEAKPYRLGDAVEMLWRFRVGTILKGKLDDELITIRHPGPGVGAGVNEISGKQWILMLSPEYMAGKHRYVGLYNVKLEPQIRAIMQVQMPQN